MEKCIICTFEDNQETIIETPDGYCHQECLDDSMDRHREYDPQSELDNSVKEEKAWERQEKDSHLHP